MKETKQQGRGRLGRAEMKGKTTMKNLILKIAAMAALALIAGCIGCFGPNFFFK